jgi:pimeloyl-ACP methyl ester carboxylesterase
MARSARITKSLFSLLVPVLIILVVALIGSSVWLVYRVARPQPTAYLITPEKFGRISSRAAQVSEETWASKDGTTSKGWLLRGAEGKAAVILFHKYGVNRSHVLNLGVRINESTDLTVLMPDLRSHGESLQEKNSSFGGCETEDSLAAIEFLRGLKTQGQMSLVGKNIGVYGVELGALSALNVAAKDKTVTAIILDSVPEDADQLTTDVVRNRFPIGSGLTTRLASLGTRLYYFDGCFKRDLSCDTAKDISDRNILLLAGVDGSTFQEPTSKLSKCLPASNKIETKVDLSPSGYSIINASMEQSDAYHQRVIDFFRQSLAE